MDALSVIEKQEVESMMEKHEELKLELLEIQKTLESYASLHSIPPPSTILQLVVETVTKDGVSSNKQPVANIAALRRIQHFKYIAIAATVLLVLSAALNWKYYLALEKANTEIAFLNQEQEKLVNNFNSMQATYDVASVELEVLQNPDNKIVKMSGTENHPESMAYVYWNVESQEVYVKIGNLPAPPTQKQYQLWALKDGIPIDAGVFDVEKGLLKVKDIEAADAFAVTLEPQGGSKQPTLEDLQVIGEIKLI